MTGRRVTVVASEILGMPRTGGAGTADSLLAVALGRHGHRVQLLVGPGRGFQLTPEWRRRYDEAGVVVRPVEPATEIAPPFLAPSTAVFDALRADPPDVVVVDDWRALAFAALRARQLDVALEATAFVVHCHGPARMLAEFARKVPDTLARFGEEVAERACFELADAVVSPSVWLLDWMRERGWPVPESARVIQYLRESSALGEPPAPAGPASRVRRLAFFGQLREGKGIRIFLAGLEQLEPELLDGIEIAFVGTETRRWTSEQILAALAPHVAERLAGIQFQTALDRGAALEELRRPGTLALMPSLLDNSPNTVSECVEHGIPFLAARTGGIPELVAEEDRDRVLFEPTAEALATALRHALGNPEGVAPAQPAHDPQRSLDAWLDVIASVAAPKLPRGATPARVDVIATGDEAVRRAQRLVEQTRSARVEVVAAPSRAAGVARASADWLVFLDPDDTPDDVLVDALVRAQSASGADVVTCAVRPAAQPAGMHAFLGSARSFGLLENQYGVVGLVRRSLVDGDVSLDGHVDPDWVLFARLALHGAQIVSIPEPLSTIHGKPGSLTDLPGDGLMVLRLFEQAEGAVPLADLPSLAATLAAAHARAQSRPEADGERPRHIVGRSLDVLRAEGVAGLARRARARLGNG